MPSPPSSRLSHLSTADLRAELSARDLAKTSTTTSRKGPGPNAFDWRPFSLLQRLSYAKPARYAQPESILTVVANLRTQGLKATTKAFLAPKPMNTYCASVEGCGK